MFLDEVADLPLSMQVKLLRAIQEKAIRKVGSNEEFPINTRILSATHKDLAAEVHAERFRNDLFYRINVIELKVPPLRERKEDIALLANFSLGQLAIECNLDKPILSDEALTLLNEYHFPGNVRELENCLERAFTLCEGGSISANDLKITPREHPSPSVEGSDNLYQAKNPQQAFGSLDAFLEEMEKQSITLALEKTRWNKTAAAELLGLSFRQLRHRLKKLNLESD